MIVFLDYLSRSGSTYLASRLARIVDIEVTIESRILRDYVPTSLNLESDQDVIDYVFKFNAYTKNKPWGLTSADLLPMKRPIRYFDVLKELLIKNYDLSKVIIKKGSGKYVSNFDSYEAVVPDLKILAVTRDPLQIYASQKTSIDSELGVPMARGVISFVREQRRYISSLTRLSRKLNVLVVDYEEISQDIDGTVLKITDWLGVKNEERDFDYFDQIPNEQKHLHGNIIKKDVSKMSKRKWRGVLSLHEKIIIKLFCKTLPSLQH